MSALALIGIGFVSGVVAAVLARAVSVRAIRPASRTPLPYRINRFDGYPVGAMVPYEDRVLIFKDPL